jgi:integrase
MSVPVVGLSSETDGNGGSGGGTNFEVGMAEPGIERFLEERRRSGSSEASQVDYVKAIGSARKLADKPILEMSKDELRALDMKLVTKAKSTRTILKMYLRDNERTDLDAVLKRQRRPRARKPSLEEILFPDEVMRLIAAARFLRDRAFIAMLYASAGRSGEVRNLRVGDVKRSNGDALQCWFGRVKSAGQERYSPPIREPWKGHIEAWMRAQPGGRDALLFPSTTSDNKPVDKRTTGELLRNVGKRAGIRKKLNHHWFRHSRISMAFANREADLATLCVWFWGVPVTPMANRYSHFQGLDAKIAEAKPMELEAVPALPVPPMVATQRQMGELTDELRELRTRYVAMERSVRVLASKLALDAGIPPGTELTVRIPSSGRPVSEVEIEEKKEDSGSQ